MAEQERVGMGRIAAKLTARADDKGMNDNKAPGQPIKYTGKKDRDFAEWDQLFIGARYGQRKPIVKVVKGTLEMSDSLPTVTCMVRMQMILIEAQIWNASSTFSMRTSHPSRAAMQTKFFETASMKQECGKVNLRKLCWECLFVPRKQGLF